MKRPWPIVALCAIWVLVFGASLYRLIVYWNRWWEVAFHGARTVYLYRAYSIGEMALASVMCYGLWQLRNWARWIMMVLCVLQIVSVFGLIQFLHRRGVAFTVPFLATFGVIVIVSGAAIAYLRRPFIGKVPDPGGTQESTAW
jgi:hypothetical protein